MSETILHMELRNNEKSKEKLNYLLEVSEKLIGNSEKLDSIIKDCSEKLKDVFKLWTIEEAKFTGNTVKLKMIGPPTGANMDAWLDWLSANGAIEISGSFYTTMADAEPVPFKLVNGSPVEPDIDENEVIDLQERDGAGHTLLHLAVESGLKSKVKFLIEKGADIEARNKAQATPIFMAVNDDIEESDAIACIDILLDAGANINAKNSQNETPLDKAIKYGYDGIANHLKARNAPVDKKSSSKPLTARGKIFLAVFWVIVIFLAYYFFFR